MPLAGLLIQKGIEGKLDEGGMKWKPTVTVDGKGD